MPLRELEKNLDYWMTIIVKATSFAALDKVKSDLLGKSGIITSAFKLMTEIPSDEKKAYGEKINKLKTALEDAIKKQRGLIDEFTISEKLKNETVDVTLPVFGNKFGSRHLITQATNRIRDHYQARGFMVLDGPEIESEFFNFDALNTPKHHPARQSHDTFYLEGFDETLLRTQTSSVQIRTMLDKGVPIRMISIGKTYRNDCLDATHSPMFHQIECLVAQRTPLSIGHLKSELKKFLSFFFEVNDVAIRFRPSFFPFTEPGMEVDCRYMKRDGKLVITKEGDRWLEIAGAGMVHPNVFRSCNVEGPAYGFAFAFGLDRIVMLKNGIQDIRELLETDIRALRHYA